MPGIDALGAYHLLRPLAAGGMAKVWLGVDACTGREVAVKRMLATLAEDPELRRAFADEGALGLRMRHPNIVDTLDVGEAMTATGANEPYLVLELLQGRALIDLLRAAGRKKQDIPLGVAIRIVADAARGLEHAHTLTGADGRPLGLVHRDVSPHNLFVCSSGVTKLLDFGIAKARSQQHHTRVGTIKGKLAYLAPEQIRGQAPDARLDVFALGIVLYELITGRPLFRGDNDAATLHNIISADIPPPELVRGDVPRSLGAVALRALQRDRNRRLPSAAALADSIEAVAEAEGIEATHASVRELAASLFPNDERVHAEDAALARRTYEYLSSSSLRALGSNPWITPPEGMVVEGRTPPTSGSKVLLALGALAITAAAALTTVAVLSRHAPSAAPAAGTPAPVAASPASGPPVAVPSTEPIEIPPVEPTSAVEYGPREPPRELPAPEPPVALRSHTSVAPAQAHKRAHAATGRFRVAAHPWAEVLVDGRSIGTTPLRAVELPEGTHVVQLRNRDLGATVRRKIAVQAGKETALVVDLFTARDK